MGRRVIDQRKEVIERWIRFKASRYGSILARRFMRVYLPVKERKRKQAWADALSVVRAQAFKLERSSYEASYILNNIALYFLLAEKDISSLKINALTHPDPWSRGLALRMILVTLYEFDLGDVAGKKLKPSLDKAKVPEHLQKKLYSGIRKARKAQQRAKKSVGDIRNAVTAHRDPDALHQYRVITALNEKEALHLLVSFYDASREFVEVLPEVMLYTGTAPSLFTQMLNDDSP